MDAETRHTLAVTDPRAFVRHPLLLVVHHLSRRSRLRFGRGRSARLRTDLILEEVALPCLTLFHREPSPRALLLAPLQG